MKKEKFNFGLPLSDSEMKSVKGGWTYTCNVIGGEFLYTDCLEEVYIWQAQKTSEGRRYRCNIGGSRGGGGGGGAGKDPYLAY